MAPQHADLTQERWRRFSLDQQILMIGNEMNRARKLLADPDPRLLKNGYERILRLADLTVGVQERPGLRRELLRWRDQIAQLYIAPTASPEEHDALLRCLLRFTPEASRQIPLLLG